MESKGLGLCMPASQSLDVGHPLTVCDLRWVSSQSFELLAVSIPEACGWVCQLWRGDLGGAPHSHSMLLTAQGGCKKKNAPLIVLLGAPLSQLDLQHCLICFNYHACAPWHSNWEVSQFIVIQMFMWRLVFVFKTNFLGFQFPYLWNR